MPRAGAAVPEARAADVGPGPRAARQVGDPAQRGAAAAQARPGELRRGLLRQVAE